MVSTYGSAEGLLKLLTNLLTTNACMQLWKRMQQRLPHLGQTGSQNKLEQPVPAKHLLRSFPRKKALQSLSTAQRRM